MLGSAPGPSGGPHPTEKKNGTGGAAAAEKVRARHAPLFLSAAGKAIPEHAPIPLMTQYNPSRRIESALYSDSYRPATTATLRYQLLVPSFSVEFVRRFLGLPFLR